MAMKSTKTKEVKTPETVKAAGTTPVQTTAKAAEEYKVAEVVKPVEKKVEEKAQEVKETAKKVVKKAASKAQKVAPEKCEPVAFVEFYGRQTNVAEVIDKVKAKYVAEGHRESGIKSLEVYLKPEENAAYYVINTKVKGCIALF